MIEATGFLQGRQSRGARVGVLRKLRMSLKNLLHFRVLLKLSVSTPLCFSFWQMLALLIKWI